MESGLSFYALLPRSSPQPAFPDDVWPDNLGIHSFVLHDGSWQVVNWDLVIVVWPRGQTWKRVVHKTLSRLIEQGSRVAWIGDGFTFSDPPYLFDPRHMSGGVLASMTAQGDFLCPLDPYEPLRTLTDEELLGLRKASEGLSDVSEAGSEDLPRR